MLNEGGRRRGKGRSGTDTLPGRFRSMLSLSSIETESNPLGSLLKPCLYFYKFLQPLGDRKLVLNLPNTALCEMAEGGKEDLLWLTTDESGHVVHVDRPITWKRKFVADVSVANDDDVRTNDDTVVAVRKVPFVKAHVAVQNQTVAVAERDLERILNGDPKRISYGVQKYIQCRGAHAALYRVQWIRGSTNNTAVNLVNNLNMSDRFEALRAVGAAPLERDPYDVAIRDASVLARFTCVSNAPTSVFAGDDDNATTWPPDVHTAKLRGQPITPALDAIQRIVAHAQLHIPVVQFNEMEGDFVKDTHGTWWCIQVKSFRYELRVPGVVALLRETDLLDSLVHVPKLLRRRPRSNDVDDPKTNDANEPTPPQDYNTHPSTTACFLCHNSFQLGPSDAEALGLVLDDADQHVSIGSAAMSGYVMTFNMVSDTLTSLRHRGVHLSSWEASLLRATTLTASGSPSGSSECRVCLMCYQIYKHQMSLCATSAAIHRYFVPTVGNMSTQMKYPSDECPRRSPSDSIIREIDAFRRERDPQDFSMPVDWTDGNSKLTVVAGRDVDPNCQQFCFFLLFHELQDVLGREDPTQYYMEYQLGQTFCTLSFDGPKMHTAHRWQLCEARMHYAFATTDALRTMCQEHKIDIKMKYRHTNAFEGHAHLSLKPLLGHLSSNIDGADDDMLLQGPTHCGVLVHVNTHHLGLLKLKVTLGLIGSHQHEFADLRGAISGVAFVQEHHVYWPETSYYQPSIALPIEWIPLFAPPDLYGRTTESTSVTSGARRPSIAVSAMTESSLMQDIQNQKRGMELQAPFSTLRRLVARLGETVDAVPTFFVATLLRTVSFWKCPKAGSTLSSWRVPSPYALTSSWTLDQLFRGVVKESKPLRLEAIALLGELLFVLLDQRSIPPMLPLSDNLEQLLTPFWLQQSPTIVLAWLAPQEAPSSCPSKHRIMWNRAVRRCQLAGFTRHPDKSFLATHEWPSTLQLHVNANDIMKHRKRLRTRMRLLLLAHLFEKIEAYDSGYLDMGEFRCLPQQLKAEAKSAEAANMPIFSSGGCTNQLAAWNHALHTQWTNAVNKTTHCLVKSRQFQEAFAQFDQYGSGGIGFREFWELAEAEHVATVTAVPSTSPGLCLRHGLAASLVDIDAVCTECDAEYVDAVDQGVVAVPGRSDSIMSSVSFTSRPHNDGDLQDDGDGKSSSDEDGIHPSRRYSYFQSFEGTAMTKDFQEKVQTRIKQRYRGIKHIPQDLGQNSKTLAAMLTQLEVAERDTRSKYPTLAMHTSHSMPHLATNQPNNPAHDAPPLTDENEFVDQANSASLRRPPLTRRPKLRPLKAAQNMQTVDPASQKVAMERLHAVPKSRKSSDVPAVSYADLLQQELQLQSRPKQDLLARISRQQRKKKELDDHVVHALQAIHATLAQVRQHHHP
ncbi:hypothetical protein H310_13142 [Aphanomyces invadans]|uniref:EF-hand domain-containing protein n=1 Tax=Aphanomyces invadans TaxID=157072 RepID=A0A024TF92_9STRA|nr:hypothetical protein H310_13142 [Aphanomyces invadans]ETV92713.1 hypothetical protein H310_13142 [Aphanomyces invadans]|eukprot:XP_008878749.1 hypothetical protein H310_13142 [Aphanomyces invadans]